MGCAECVHAVLAACGKSALRVVHQLICTDRLVLATLHGRVFAADASGMLCPAGTTGHQWRHAWQYCFHTQA